jgi:F0F1-type ATP synthase assembly protein I
VRDLVERVTMDDTDRGTPMGTRFTKHTGETLRAAGALSTVGLAFVFALVIGFWFGTVLDGWLGTRPAFTIVFFFFGLAAGILNVYRIVSQAYPGSTPPPGTATRDDRPDDRDLQDGDD